MLRVRRDVAGRLELPGASEVAGGDDRVHYSLDRANRGDCSPLPIRAFVLLRLADSGITLERVPADRRASRALAAQLQAADSR